ncbi:hypothetical protein AXW83_06600 [Bosea sp. PAMC 26642]|nr:hypothetical protein AXW83_06600 [Bosea sp. PAMC 26642]
MLISTAQVATPGPSTVFPVNNAITYGPRRAIVALSGDLAAIIILASLSAVGVGALLAANAVLFTAFRLAGPSISYGSAFAIFVRSTPPQAVTAAKLPWPPTLKSPGCVTTLSFDRKDAARCSRVPTSS